MRSPPLNLPDPLQLTHTCFYILSIFLSLSLNLSFSLSHFALSGLSILPPPTRVFAFIAVCTATDGVSRGDRDGDGDGDGINIDVVLDEVQEVRASASASLGAPLLSLPKGSSINIQHDALLENIRTHPHGDVRHRSQYRGAHRFVI